MRAIRAALLACSKSFKDRLIPPQTWLSLTTCGPTGGGSHGCAGDRMIAPVPHFTPPAHTGPPYWRCCDVIGHPGETECWACGKGATPVKPPPLHHSAGSVLVHQFPDDLPEVDRLIVR